MPFQRPIHQYRFPIIDGDLSYRDPFGRLRVSQPETLFNSKLLGDDRPIFWQEAEVSGSGTSGTYSRPRASKTLIVSADTAGRRVRQTYQRWNYEPGKGQLIMMTFVAGQPTAGITRRIGYGDDSNGLFLEQDGDGVRFVIRSSTSGSPVDEKYEQDEWSVDAFEDFQQDAAQILWIDFESLQVGSVRFAFVINGQIQYKHIQHHSNILSAPYFSSPNLPIRYEIENDGTGPEATLECICTTVISEGGTNETGIVRGVTTEGVALSATTQDTLYAFFGFRLKSTHLDNIVILEDLTIMVESNDDFLWEIRLNPTVAGTFTYADQTNSAIQVALGATANTVTGGIIMPCGGGKSGQSTTSLAKTLRYLGASIDGTPDEFVVCVRPLGNAALFQGAVNWRENA